MAGTLPLSQRHCLGSPTGPTPLHSLSDPISNRVVASYCRVEAWLEAMRKEHVQAILIVLMAALEIPSCKLVLAGPG